MEKIQLDFYDCACTFENQVVSAGITSQASKAIFKTFLKERNNLVLGTNARQEIVVIDDTIKRQ